MRTHTHTRTHIHAHTYQPHSRAQGGGVGVGLERAPPGLFAPLLVVPVVAVLLLHVQVGLRRRALEALQLKLAQLVDGLHALGLGARQFPDGLRDALGGAARM